MRSQIIFNVEREKERETGHKKESAWLEKEAGRTRAEERPPPKECGDDKESFTI